MTLVEGFVRDEVFIDFGSEVSCGSDQVYLSYPCRFPTVGFQLMATNGLSRIADRIRRDAGYAPMHPMDEYDGNTCDQEGWYDFFCEINGLAGNRMGSCIEFVVVNSASGDNEEMYAIDLTVEEQEAVYRQLDAQCRKYLGKTCGELLREAREQMEDTP